MPYSMEELSGKAEEAKFKAKMSAIKEEWRLYITEQITTNFGDSDTKQLYVGGDIIYDIIADEEIEIDIGLIKDIRKILHEVGDEEEKFTMVFEGELYYVSQSSIPNNKDKVKWCQDLGIKIWEYKAKANNKVVNGDYKLIKRSLPMYAQIKHRICQRKNQIHQRKRRKSNTRKLDYKKPR